MEAKFFEVRRQVFALTDEIAARAASALTNVLTAEAERMQKHCGEMQRDKQAAERDRDTLIRANAALRTEGAALTEANAAKRAEGEKLDAANAELAAQIQAQRDKLARLTTAVTAATEAV